MTTETTSQPSGTTLPLQPPAKAAPALSSLALLTVLLGVLLPIVDFFIVNVALPTMAGDLQASSATLELVVSGYATTYAVFLVIGGRIGDAFGRRRLFIAGIAAFTVASLLCGLAPSAAWLVAARILQGAAASLVVPQVLATIQATGDGQSRARALGWYGATAGIAAVAGQAIGGLLVSANIGGSQWRPIFLVNVPIGLIAMLMGFLYVPETRAQRVARPDLPGAALLAAAVVSLLIPLTEGRAVHWPWWSWVLLASTPAWVAGFVRVERGRERDGRDPLVPPSLLRHRSMRRGLLLAAPFFGGFGAFMFVYALMAQGSLGYSPLKAGLALTPMAVAFLIASLQIARLVPRWGRTVITAGGVIQLVGLLMLVWTLEQSWPHTSPWDLFASFTVMGFGQGLTMPSLIRVVLSEVPIESAGAGGGVFTTMQQLSLAVGVASLGTLFISLSATSHLGVLHATVVLLAIQSVVAVGVVGGSRLLPRK